MQHIMQTKNQALQGLNQTSVLCVVLCDGVLITEGENALSLSHTHTHAHMRIHTATYRVLSLYMRSRTRIHMTM